MSRLMTRFYPVLLLVCWFFALPSSGQAAGRPDYRETMQDLSLQVHEQLDGLREQSRNLTEQLRIAESELALSSAQVSALQTELTDLNTCLENTNRKLADYSTKLTEYEVKLKARARIIRTGIALLVLFILVRAVLILLKLKFGIKIPYWVNLIL